MKPYRTPVVRVVRPVLLAAVLAAAVPALGQIRVVTYNDSNDVAGSGTGLSTILKAIGDESHAGIAKPIDVISLQEQNNDLAGLRSVASMLNGIYGAGTYAASTVAGNGDSTQGIVYNTKTVQLVSQQAILSTSSTAAARQPMLFDLRPVGYDASADFYLISSHYKAGSTATDYNRRAAEAQQLRAYTDATLGANARIMYTGDFNVYSNTDGVFKNLTAAGAAQGIDPVNQVGAWSGNSAFAAVHTQSPVVSDGQNYNGQTGGGMDDRFDWQLDTAPVLSGRGVSYISGTYHAFGNAGVQYNRNITDGNAASVLLPNFPGYSTSQVQSVLQALATASDHIPVVADYRVPAKMQVGVGAVPSRVIVGANVTVPVSVANAATAITVDSADRLDFTVSGSGAVSGGGTGSDAALGGAASSSITLNAASAGVKSGGVAVVASSPGAANPNFSQSVTYTVLNHSNGSFSSAANGDSLTVDLGSIPAGGAGTSRQVSLFNLGSSADTAGLALTSVVGSGDTSVLNASLQAFSNLSAGSSTLISVALDADHVGTFSATYTFYLSDEALPGSIAGDPLTLTLTGRVVAVPEPTLCSSLSLSAAVWGTRRRRR